MIVFVVVVIDIEWPSRLYLVADFAVVQLNVRDRSIAFTELQSPVIRGAGRNTHKQTPTKRASAAKIN